MYCMYMPLGGNLVFGWGGGGGDKEAYQKS